MRTLTNIKDEGDELLDGTGQRGAALIQGQLRLRHLALLNLQRIEPPRYLHTAQYM